MVFLIYFIYERFELVLLVGPREMPVSPISDINIYTYIGVHIAFIGQSLICRFIFMLQRKSLFLQQCFSFSTSKEALS